MKVRKGHLGDEAPRLLELTLRLAGEADHHVGPDAGAGHQRTGFFKASRVVSRTVAPAHRLQNRVRARLQRDVDVLGDALLPGHQSEQVVGPVHRLDRAEPKLDGVGRPKQAS